LRHPCESGSTERYQPAVPRATPPPAGEERLVATLRKQPSGCSLRTQQRARPTPSPAADRSHPNPQGSYGVLGATSSKAGHSRCSTLEHRPPLVRQGQRAWTPQPPHDRTT